MNFTWEGFEQERFVVHCETEEASLDFIKKCKERGYCWMTWEQLDNSGYNRYKNSVCYQLSEDGRMSFASYSFFKKEKRIVVKWEMQDAYNFFQVVNIIRKGETYQCGSKFIKFVDDVVTIGDNTGGLSFTSEDKFVKKEKVNFSKAHDYMTEGKTLKCLYDNHYYKIADGDLYYSGNNVHWTITSLTLAQIQSDWTVE